MKNPLVEALRQASGNSPSSDRDEPTAEDTAASEQAETPSVEQTAETDHLQLQEATGIVMDDVPNVSPANDLEILPIDGPGILPIDGPGILPIDGPDGSGGEETDAEFDQIRSMQLASEEPGGIAVDKQDADPAPYPPVTHSGKCTGIARLGLYSPLICLCLAAAAAGAYMLFQNAGGRSHAPELASLSSQSGIPPDGDAPESAEPDRPVNPFKLIVAPQTAAQPDAHSVAENLQSARGTLPSDTENLVR